MSVSKQSRLKRVQQGYNKFRPATLDLPPSGRWSGARQRDTFRSSRRSDCKKAHGIWGPDWYHN